MFNCVNFIQTLFPDPKLKLRNLRPPRHWGLRPIVPGSPFVHQHHIHLTNLSAPKSVAYDNAILKEASLMDWIPSLLSHMSSNLTNSYDLRTYIYIYINRQIDNISYMYCIWSYQLRHGKICPKYPNIEENQDTSKLPTRWLMHIQWVL